MIKFQTLVSVESLAQAGALDIGGLTQNPHVFTGLVVARFRYALPAIAGQLSVDDPQHNRRISCSSVQMATYVHIANCSRYSSKHRQTIRSLEVFQTDAL